MPAFIIQQPDGKFARFSTVVDDFTHVDMDEDEVRATLEQLACQRARDTADRIIVEAIEKRDRWNECLHVRKAIHGKDDNFKEIVR